jgi:hypothetical protein
MSRTPALLVAVLAAAAALAPALPAAAVDEVGYVRVGHLSPDTAAADVSLTALSGGTTMYSLKGVPYGGVSKYMSLAPGTYALSMAPTVAGTNTPLVTADVEVTPGMASTIVAIGPNASIHLVTIQDDLSSPASGKARVRVVHAATTQPEVTVKTADGTTLADKAQFGSTGQYTEVPPGSTSLTLTTASGDTPATVDLPDAANSTVFVLDASGGLTVLAVVDSAGVTETPVGGMGTGGGALALASRSAAQGTAGAALLAVLAALLAVPLVRSRRGSAARA